ncbi:hypothetical protein L3Q70_04830 [Pseudoalteromonas sp. CF6-2]|uniref:hypothetical protein n=1 Tax=Pseudoalteromonas sp. CF6-2 TaxID=562716 RepID=UPI001F2E46B2|nr:hypothetical protein L3Q70_04830 [Pseudoalteromonas sp. CF6-2]
MRLLLTLFMALLTGCVAMQESKPPPQHTIKKFSISEELPTLPSGSRLIPGTHFSVIFADSAATLLVPVPFVGEAVTGAINSSKSESYKEHYVGIDILKFAKEAFSRSEFYSEQPQATKLFPVAYVQECFDDVFRISLAIEVDSDNWVGRYLYHIPTHIPVSDVKNPTQLEVETLSFELNEGMQKLTELIERDIRGQLNSTNKSVDFGSYYIYGSNLGGLITPSVMHLSDGQLIEEGNDYVIFRHSGDPSVAGNAGALLFGVHYFRKEQLHTFEVIE